MEPLYDVSAEAQNDLFEIWRRIAADSVELAERIDGGFHELFGSLGRMPRKGHTRKDLTKRPVAFFLWLLGKRNTKRILSLKERI